MPADADWMLIGQVVGAFGVRGEIKVEPLTDFPERFRHLSRVFLGPDRQPVRVLGVRPHKSHILMRLAGVDTPEAVDDLRSQELFVPRGDAIPLPEGHYYLDDVIGLRVVTPDNQPIGIVTDVIRTGSNDVYVVNEGKDALLIPAIKDAVRELSFDRREVVVEPWVLAPEE